MKRKLSTIAAFLVLAATTLGLSACSDVNEAGSASLYPHPTDWVIAGVGGLHPLAYSAKGELCGECHGSAQDAQSSGGISGVSCFSPSRNGITCHPGGPSGHPADWAIPKSHGSAAKSASPGLNSCRRCHGSDFSGEGGPSCFGCHLPAPHPVKPWVQEGRTHIDADPANASSCALCHTSRENLSATGLAALPTTPVIGTSGCFDNTLCHGVMGHGSDPQPWSAAANHGTRAKLDPGTNSGFSSCQNCHGTDFATDRSGFTCFSCHTSSPHPAAAEWRNPGTLTHTTIGVNNAPACNLCHNATTKNLASPFAERFQNSPAGSFSAGSPSCYTATLCHGDVTKTSNCDACHSTAATTPFRSLSGATATSDSKVGAHVKHLQGASQSPPHSADVTCSECHPLPSAPAATGAHRDETNTVTFGSLAKTGSLTPVYNSVNGACVNTYCHGASLNGGTNKAPGWNQSGYLTGCDTCHGNPPATRRGGAAHTSNSNCSGCHPHVNSDNDGFTTSGAALHINGSVEGFSEHSYPYPGAAHRSAAPSSCFGCHPANLAGSPYPVSSGTPPNCRGCHLNANPGTTPQCSDCHGDSLTGKPNGSTFPNRRGQHQRSKHSFSCTVCHPFTAGDIRHGWANGLKSSSAQVNANTTTGWNATTKNCKNSCHGTESWY